MEIDDLLEFGAESLLKSFIRKELIREGIDLDNWGRKSASVLAGGFGAIIGGIMGGPLGVLMGALLYAVGQSAEYPEDRSPEEVKREYREALRLKAIERCVKIIADNTPDELHPEIKQAFYSCEDRVSDFSADQVANIVQNILSSVDYSTGSKFRKLYNAAISEIG